MLVDRRCVFQDACYISVFLACKLCWLGITSVCFCQLYGGCQSAVCYVCIPHRGSN